MDKNAIILNLLSQMKDFLDGSISKEEYGKVAEETITKVGKYIDDTDFYRAFMEVIPELCLDYIDEPGDEQQKDMMFIEGMKNAYKELASTAYEYIKGA